MTEEIEDIVRFNVDEECTQTIHGNSIKVFSSQGSHNKGSSKLTLKNFVNFNWDQCYYRGQLIALHISEKYIAYGFSNTDTFEGLVRVVKTESKERALIKGFSNLIEDISFAHLYEIIMLACIDQSGTTNVYVIKEENCTSNLRVFPVFQINGDPSYCFKNKYLLSWCQFIPEQVNHLKELEFEPTYKGKILAVVRASEVEIWHVGVASNFTDGPVFANMSLNKSMDKHVLNNINNAVIKIDLKEADIISLSFSPDGSTISLALNNGSIYFYQVSFDHIADTPKRVFTWLPKEIFLSLKSLAFLDNRKTIDGDVELWKYVVTLSNDDEIILWSCETWKILQKVKFVRSFSKLNSMKLTIDGTGRYIFLSDIDNNLLYVMEVTDDIKTAKKNIKIISITEVLLQSPMLNMIIGDVKIDRNDLDLTENHNSNNILSSKYTTTINLFAIQPKSLQEGQLIIESPVLSNTEHCSEQINIESTNIFPKPPILDLLIEPVDSTTTINNSEVQEFQIRKEENILQDLTPLEVHSLVKEKLRLKGISLNPKSASNSSNSIQIQNRQKNNYNNIQPIVVQPSSTYSYPQDFDLNEARECSPSNNEVQTILQQQTDQESQYNYMETHNDNFETVSNYSNGIDEKEENNCYSSNSVFNGSEISTIRRPLDKSNAIDNSIGIQMDDILTTLQNMNTQLKCISKKQKKIDNQINAAISMNSSSLCENLEPVLMNMVKNASDQSHRKLQIMIDHQLNSSHKKITEIVKATNSNKVDTELFTRSLVASLNPTLDAILKDLFMSTVIPKFEHACCSMFKQIDASFTERSLEYQNELKSLLNEDGNINNKLEYAFDKFKVDMHNIIKSTEKKILSTQQDMQKQFSILLKEKSHVEPCVKDMDNTANQFIILSDIIKLGDYALAFEKALSASKLELVLFVCEKVKPELLFISPNTLKTPIVLSLIQQLSHDLINNTELKHKYLEAAIGSLDYTNDHYKENINLVLIKTDTSVEKFVQHYPLNPYSRKLKMLQLAIKSMISYFTVNI
ncbi:enhancer of mRNA-decapping protein 4 [Melanaphis sacchari]|uniref:Enhancer of mRNA-decapping protein 4 n=2 Tax=Melanaphis sacchari TaxID=742174 RepID=A0A2H8TPJ5_9HEMI|nr:enhancer of mRNA-decapping protein 4 [Melanaphis sacchari]XP_025194257.1 enhancer of mRNA-decapping protein 4 [Melanaphis sacchari]